MSDSIKPIHFLKVLHEDKEKIEIEKNDVISKIADFDIHTFFYKNIVYKNIKAKICWIFF